MDSPVKYPGFKNKQKKKKHGQEGPDFYLENADIHFFFYVGQLSPL